MPSTVAVSRSATPYAASGRALVALVSRAADTPVCRCQPRHICEHSHPSAHRGLGGKCARSNRRAGARRNRAEGIAAIDRAIGDRRIIWRTDPLESACRRSAQRWLGSTWRRNCIARDDSRRDGPIPCLSRWQQRNDETHRCLPRCEWGGNPPQYYRPCIPWLGRRDSPNQRWFVRCARCRPAYDISASARALAAYRSGAGLVTGWACRARLLPTGNGCA